jgi:hypothetical protein
MQGRGNLGIPATATAAANTAVVVTLPAIASEQFIDYLEPSYDGTPTGGLLSVTFGGNLVYRSLISNAGPGPRNVLWRIPNSTEVVITLAAGGSGVTGRLNYTAGFA